MAWKVCLAFWVLYNFKTEIRGEVISHLPWLRAEYVVTTRPWKIQLTRYTLCSWHYGKRATYTAQTRGIIIARRTYLKVKELKSIPLH